MKVAINNYPLKSGHKNRGIGVYTKYLVESLEKQKDLEIEYFNNPNQLRNVDIVHYPTFDFFKPTLPLLKKYPTVVTIHDVTPLLFPKYYPAGIRGTINNLIQRLSLLNVSGVITDSENSKKDIHKVLGIKENKIYVTYLAPAGHYQKINNKVALDKVKNKYRLPKEFILFTGNVNWNKNILNTTAAALKAGVEIVIVGKSFEQTENLDHPELKTFKQFKELYSNNPKVHILGFVEDLDLVAITNLATAVVLVSFYEGFGMPILEAQTCGIPVITANNSSLVEVSGDSVLYADPNNIDEIAAAIKKLLVDNELRQILIKKGYLNIKRFSWEKCAKETLRVYEKAAAK